MNKGDAITFGQAKEYLRANTRVNDWRLIANDCVLPELNGWVITFYEDPDICIYENIKNSRLHIYVTDVFTAEEIAKFGKKEASNEANNVVKQKADRSQPRNKYDREILPNVFVDVYDVLNAFTTGSPALDHAAKKLLAPGQRGVKDRKQDIQEVIQSCERELERLSEWGDGDDAK